MKPYKLAIVTTHPIQYYAPWFRYICTQGDIQLHVFYTWGESGIKKYEKDFNTQVEWDIDLLTGYPYTFCKNIAKSPGTSNFWGILAIDLAEKIKAFDPDEVCIYGWAWWSHFWLIVTYKGKALLSFRGDSHLLDQPQSKLYQAIKYSLLRYIYSKIKRFYSVGIANEAYYSYYKVPQSKILRLPHAIDNQRFRPDAAFKREIRNKYGISNDKIVILFVGKLIPKKAPIELIKSVLSTKRTDLEVLIIGSGTLAEEVKYYADSYPNVHYLGFVNQKSLPMYYGAADVLCLPSKGPNETWGLVANEAMASGIPVIVSDKCGCAYDLVTEETGWVFTTLDDLIYILKNLDLKTCTMKGKKAQARVTDLFDYKINYLKLKHNILLNK